MPGEFLRLVEAQNESLGLIITYYMCRYTTGIETTLLESLRSKKIPIKDSVQAKLVVRNKFLRHVTFYGLLDLKMSL